MNKIPLSLVAMAAVSVPAVAQDATSQETYDDLIRDISLLIQKVNGYEALPSTLRDGYLDAIAEIQKELNEDWNDNNKLDKGEAYYRTQIGHIETEAGNHNGYYVTYNTLTAAYDALNEKKTQADAKADEFSTEFADYKKKQIKALNIEAIDAKIKAFKDDKGIINNGEDLKNQAENIKKDIADKTAAIEELMKNVETKAATYDANEAAKEELKGLVAGVRTDYTTKLSAIVSLLEQNYTKWYDKAKAEMGAAANKVDEAEKLGNVGESDTELIGYANDEIKATANSLLDEAKVIVNGNDKTPSVLAKYETLVGAYEAAKAEADGVKKDFEAYKAALVGSEMYDDNKTAADKIEADIAALIAALDKAALTDGTEKVADFDIDDAMAGINEAFNTLKNNTQSIVDNYEANKRIVALFDTAEAELDKAVKAAKEALSADKAYNAADHFEKFEAGIRNDLKEQREKAGKSYENKTSVSDEAGYADAVDTRINAAIADYKTLSAAALEAYNNVHKPVEDIAEALESYKETVGRNTTVPILLDGYEGQTYGDVLDGVSGQVQAIENAIAEANKKDGREHLQALESINIGVSYTSDELKTLEDSFAADKAHYDKQVTIDAAGTLNNLAAGKLNTLYNQLQEILTGITETACGEAQAEVLTASANEQLQKIQDEIDKLAEEFDKIASAGEDDPELTDEEKFNSKHAAASLFANYIAELNKRITEYEAAKVELSGAIDKAKSCYTTYKSLTTLLAGINTAIETQRNYIASKRSDATFGSEGLDFYDEQLNGYEETYTKAVTDLEEDLEEVKCGESDARVTKGILEALKKDIDGVKGAVDANNTAHNQQVKNYNDIVGALNDLYNKIQTEDQSQGATGRLAEIEEVRATTLAELEKKIAELFAAGDSKNNESEVTALQNKIKEVTDRLDKEITGDEHIQEMIETNAANHVRFVEAYGAANEVFSKAVGDLSLFASITDGELKDALDGLLSVHNDIYGYVEKLRKLYNDESEAYAPYTSTGEKKGELYEVGVWINTANAYESEIKEKMETYRTALNTAAQNLYNGKIAAADAALTAAKNELERRGYSETVREGAYGTITEQVTATKEMAGLMGGDNKLDSMYAYKIQPYLELLNTINELIDAESDVLANSEWNYRKHEADTKIAWEAERLDEFVPGTIVDYYGRLKVSQERIDAAKVLNGEQKEMIPAAFAEYMTIDDTQRFEKLAEMLDKLPQFTTAIDVEGTPQLHTREFASIYNDLFADGENAKAFDAIFAVVADARESIAADVEFVNSFFAAHTAGSPAATELNRIQTKLNTWLSRAEDGRRRGNCAAILAEAKGYCENTADAPAATIAGDMKTLRDMMVRIYEASALNGQVTVLKGLYNEVVAQDVTKDYQELETRINALPDNISDVVNGYMEATGDDAIAAAQETARTAYMEIEAEIAELNRTLTELDKNKAGAHDNALSDLNSANGDIETLLATIDGWFAEFEAIADITFASPKQAYGEAVAGAKADLQTIKDNIADVDAAGSLLFYKDNILNDIAAVKTTLDNIVYSGGLEAQYNRYKANKTRYEALLDEINVLTADLAKVYDTVMAYEEEGVDFYRYIDTDGDGYTERVDIREYRYNNISRTIEASTSALEARYAAIALTDASTVDNKSQIEDRTARLLSDMTYLFATQRIGLRAADIATVKTMLRASLREDNKSKRYLTSVYNELMGKANALDYTDGALDNYNEEAYNFGILYSDIDGNPYLKEDGTPDPRTLDGGYMDVAEEVETKYQELKTQVEQLVEDANNRWYYIGDANADGLVNVADYNIIRRYILDPDNCTYDKLGEREAAGADVNKDEEINVADLTCVSNLIFHNDWNWTGVQSAPAAGESRADAVSLSADNEETNVFGKTIRLAVNLDNTVPYVAYQMDIRLPEGMTLAGESLTERANGHELLSADIADGQHRVLVSMLDNNAFEAASGAVLYLDVEVDGSYSGGNVELSNIIFTDADGRTYRMDALSTNNPTGIGSITAPTVSERVYSVGGQLMKAVKKGVNIIVGSDGTAKKVFNK